MDSTVPRPSRNQVEAMSGCRHELDMGKGLKDPSMMEMELEVGAAPSAPPHDEQGTSEAFLLLVVNNLRDDAQRGARWGT